MIYSWIVTFEVNWDASHHEAIVVKSHTRKKAIELARQKLKDKYNFKILTFCYIEKFSNSKVNANADVAEVADARVLNTLE